MTTSTSTSESAARRATLQTSRNRWNRTDKYEIAPMINADTRKCDEDSVERWLMTISKADTKPEVVLETFAVKPIRRNESGEDDLALGVEASLYGKRSLKAVRDVLRSSLDPPSQSRWNSFASTPSIPSDVSIMDVLNILKDDPEELLLDLGFGIEEPDITGRIPARFLNYQSSARGINIQLFLEAQQNRMDIENADVRNRFRQLEVLQQVTTTFSSLVGASGQDAKSSTASRLSAEVREKRKRMAMMLRKAYKKSRSQALTLENQQVFSASMTPSVPESPLTDKRVPSKRTRMAENSLFPLEEEDHVNSESVGLLVNSPEARGTSDLLKINFVPSSKEGGLQRPLESFELEEIQSFDEGSVSGSCNGPVDPGGERIQSYVMRTNSCQSDSSGFLEEPFIPALTQQNNPELMKMLNAISQDSTESQQKSSEQREMKDLTTDEQNCPTQSNQKHSADSRTINPGELRKIISEQSNSPDINQIRNDNVYTLAYFVQMDPISYKTEIRDRSLSESPDRRVYKEGISLFEELKSAEMNSHLCPTDLKTEVLEKEVGKRDPALELIKESNQEKPESGRYSPTALKLRRESFSRTSRSEVITDRDSGTAQTPLTSVDTSPPHLWTSEECCGDTGHFRTRSVSLDTGLSYEEEDHRLQGALWAGAQRCFHCGSQINYDNGWTKPQLELSSNLPYSLDELEDMLKCLKKFRTVLTEIEVRLEDEQASVFGSLSDSHREEVEDVLRLRAAVKQEAGMLEQQLSDLVHNYDDSIKMKLNRLMDEQSELCTQLRITPSDTPHSQPTSTRSVAVQCCLLPVMSSPQRCVHHHCTCHGNQRATCQDPYRFPSQTQWDANRKPDRLDFLAFIKSLKNSLQHSINSNPLE
ncbi:protein ITPRID1 [Danio rerio]|uniref:Protein ITPRID1 n=1 Tax=Danio rerio TaxID=7955 RepID=A0A8M1RMS8_DANRE|nr:coiled-coil domain-containing protein 129 [Danio rerio]XP_005162917.1 coiled-coil domain-containing protein 129 [Danio rerio]|eukprot:XP_002666731.1 coiled-coil domain-containing protein 129 [Danio rerio]